MFHFKVREWWWVNLLVGRRTFSFYFKLFFPDTYNFIKKEHYKIEQYMNKNVTYFSLAA